MIWCAVLGPLSNKDWLDNNTCTLFFLLTTANKKEQILIFAICIFFQDVRAVQIPVVAAPVSTQVINISKHFTFSFFS
jgi:hypothetical protein